MAARHGATPVLAAGVAHPRIHPPHASSGQNRRKRFGTPTEPPRPSRPICRRPDGDSRSTFSHRNSAGCMNSPAHPMAQSKRSGISTTINSKTRRNGRRARSRRQMPKGRTSKIQVRHELRAGPQNRQMGRAAAGAAPAGTGTQDSAGGADGSV
jgi:hypothetical protein